jgi:hypothetical protein
MESGQQKTARSHCHLESGEARPAAAGSNGIVVVMCHCASLLESGFQPRSLSAVCFLRHFRADVNGEDSWLVVKTDLPDSNPCPLSAYRASRAALLLTARALRLRFAAIARCRVQSRRFSAHTGFPHSAHFPSRTANARRIRSPRAYLSGEYQPGLGTT